MSEKEVDLTLHAGYCALQEQIANAAGDREVKQRINTDYGETEFWAGHPFVIGLGHCTCDSKEYTWSFSHHHPDRGEDQWDGPTIKLSRADDAEGWLVYGKVYGPDGGEIPNSIKELLGCLDLDVDALKKSRSIKESGDLDYEQIPLRSDASVKVAFEFALKRLFEGE